MAHQDYSVGKGGYNPDGLAMKPDSNRYMKLSFIN